MVFKTILLCKLMSFKRRVKRMAEFLIEKVFRGGLLSLVMTTLVWISVFSYVVFYYANVPAPSYVRPVHLQIDPCHNKTEDCLFPFAYVRLTKKHQLLMMGQQYKFFIQLEMPESPVNKNLGMFMVCIQLKDKNGFLISQSCRSSMMHYHSDLLAKAKLILFSPLFIFGAKEEKQTVTFELYSDFEEDQNHPVTDLYVEVQAQNIEIYSAMLHINAFLVGLRYFMYYWPLTSAILGISFNLCVVFFATSLSFYHNFFIDSAPVQIIRNHLKRLEAQTDRLLNEQSTQ